MFGLGYVELLIIFAVVALLVFLHYERRGRAALQRQRGQFPGPNWNSPSNGPPPQQNWAPPQQNWAPPQQNWAPPQPSNSILGEVWRILCALGIVCLMALVGFNYLRTGNVASFSLAQFHVTQQRGDDTCSSIFDYCAHVECVVTNQGPIGGSGLVQIELSQGTRMPIVFSQQTYLNAGEARRIVHDFPEADLFDRTPNFSCRVR